MTIESPLGFLGNAVALVALSSFWVFGAYLLVRRCRLAREQATVSQRTIAEIERRQARANHFTRRSLAEARFFADERRALGAITGMGLVSLSVAGAGTLAAAIAYLSLNDPGVVATAHASFSQALTSPALPGQRLTDVALTAIQERRQAPADIREITFVPQREVKIICEPDLPECAPNQPTRAVQSWLGRLHWEERPSSRSSWVARSCTTQAVQSANGIWSLSGTRTC